MSKFEKPADVKVILLGDSAVGKSKLIERYLLNDFVPQQLSTYALTMYRQTTEHPLNPSKSVTVEFWDTAGQERFQSMHPSYYLSAHCCILCFDMTRKITYKNLDTWYEELIANRGISVPVIVVANKVDMDPSRANKTFGFVERRRQEREEAAQELDSDDDTASDNLPFYLCSASDGTNVVAAFREAVRRAVLYKESLTRRSSDRYNSNGSLATRKSANNFVDEVLEFLREEEKSKDGGIFRSSANSDTTLNEIAQS